MIFLPIKPKYTSNILLGIKQVEFRKNSFKKNLDNLCLIYSSSPEKKIVGYFHYELDVVKISEVFKKYGNVGCINEEELKDYYGKNKFSYVLIIQRLIHINAISVDQIFPGLKIPQSFCYLSEEQKNIILNINKKDY